MHDTRDELENGESWQIGSSAWSLAKWVPAIALLSGIMFQHGYWSAFKFDIIPYVTITDIVTRSITPLSAAAPIIAIHVFMIWFCSKIFFRKGSKRDTAIWSVIVVGASAVGFGLSEIIPWPPNQPSAGVFEYLILIGIPLGLLFLMFTERARALIPHPPIRVILFVFLGVAPCIAWAGGRLKASNILSAQAYLAVYMSPELANQLRIANPEDVRWIGHTGEVDFFLADGKMVIARGVETIQLERRESKQLRMRLLNPVYRPAQVQQK